MNSKKIFLGKNINLGDILFVDSALYLNSEKALVFGDLHIGIENSLAKHGFLVPYFNTKQLITKIKRIYTILKQKGKDINKIILNGDIKDDLYIDNNTKKDLNLFLQQLYLISKDIIIVKGNHDMFLEKYVDKKYNIKFKEKVDLKKYVVVHGHKDINSNKIKIINHEHIAITINHNNYKCFLVNKEKDLIILPSFNYSNSADILKYKFLSPIVKNKLHNFFDWNIIIFENNEFFLFKVKDLEELNV